MGWILGSRLVLVEHRGRVTGRPRHVVLEVVAREADRLTVASGYGPTSQWYRNVVAYPQVRVWSGRRRGAPAVACPVRGQDALAVFERYRRRHPRLTRMLARALGIKDLTGHGPLPIDLPDRVPLVELALSSTSATGGSGRSAGDRNADSADPPG